jgi:hypothetical protein
MSNLARLLKLLDPEISEGYFNVNCVQFSVRDFVNAAERDKLVKKHGYMVMA